MSEELINQIPARDHRSAIPGRDGIIVQDLMTAARPSPRLMIDRLMLHPRTVRICTGTIKRLKIAKSNSIIMQ